MNLRPLSDLILVKLDPFKEVSKGGIELITDNTVSSVRTATVLRVGPGRWVGKHRQLVGLEPGEKIAFLRWHLEHQTGKQVTGFLSELGENLALLRAADVLFAFHSLEKIEVSQ